ncbi:hypothetical protein BC829DRAFT_280180 [Chytridium lagenaria]|nr:hypothetical protein BC829DRAFT_280180 [Chytridium lagenaria]
MASTDAAAKQPPTAFSTTTNPYPKERPDGTTPKAEFSTAYPFILTAKPSRYLRWALWFLVAIVVSITVLTPLGVFTARSNDKVFNDFGTSYVSPVLKRAGCDPGGILEFCNQLGDNVAVINVAPIKFDPVRGLTVGFSGSVSITPTELFFEHSRQD